MRTLSEWLERESSLVIGLMSGTCTDGIDAALLRIEGSGLDTRVELLAFLTEPYTEDIRNRLLRIASGEYGGSGEISKINFLIGHLSAKACCEVCKRADIQESKVDFIGSHGHTIYHQPIAENYLGYPVISTLQIGEAAVIAEKMGCPVVSDFRVRDMAAGGQGAPLVPYTEYLLYGALGKNIALQNIGGIGNITFLPESGRIEDIIAFDTGPGNMVIDALTAYYSNNTMLYDDGGRMAASGKVNNRLLNCLLQDTYIMQKPPKTTGREKYGTEFVTQMIEKASLYHMKAEDVLATATMLTAASIEKNVKYNLPQIPERLIIGGGGSSNKTLINYLKMLLPQCEVLTNEEVGFHSDAKEAIAFAVLANETIHGNRNNVPSATGAKHGVVMGKITVI